MYFFEMEVRWAGMMNSCGFQVENKSKLNMIEQNNRSTALMVRMRKIALRSNAGEVNSSKVFLELSNDCKIA